jgi:hypothetical protein
MAIQSGSLNPRQVKVDARARNAFAEVPSRNPSFNFRERLQIVRSNNAIATIALGCV